MRAAALAIVLLCAGVAHASFTLTKTGQAQDPPIGGTVSYTIQFARITPTDTNVVLHDLLPANHTLVSVSAGTTLTCGPGASGPIGGGLTATCDAGGGDLQIAIPNAISSATVSVIYQLGAAVRTSTNTVSATCSGAACGTPSSATKNVCTPTLTLAKSVDSSSVPPGGTLTYTITATNPSSCPTSGVTITDTLPAGLTVRSVSGAGATASGQTVTARPPGAIVTGTPYTFTITAQVDAATQPGTLTNTASATWTGGGPTSATAQVTVSRSAPVFKKQIDKPHAKVGDSVSYSLSFAPSGATPGGIHLHDTFDRALRITTVTVDGQPAACGAMPAPTGAFNVSCGADGRTLDVTSAAPLAMPLTVQVGATILPLAGPTIPNTATFDDGSGNLASSSALLTVDNGGTQAALVVTSGKVLASRGDLVPFAVSIGIPTGAAPLAQPVLVLDPTRGLRIGDVQVTAPDGTTSFARPVESRVNGTTVLTVPLPALPAGSLAGVQVRARVTARAGVGDREILHARLLPAPGAPTPVASADGGVRIIVEPEFDLATVLGEVYRDDNENGVRDPGERGIEGALVVMDDGLQVVTDGEGRYHMTAVVPGERALKLAKHTLPPSSRFITDETRVLNVTPGIVLKVDFGVKVPMVEPPPPRPPLVSMALPELRPSDAGGLVYRLTGTAQPGARVSVSGKPAKVEKNGAWSVDVILARGRSRLAVVTELGDGRVVVAARDVYWIDRGAGGSLIVPRPEEPLLTLRFPAGALAEPTFLLEGVAAAPLASLTIAGQALVPDSEGRVALKLRVPEAGAGIAVDAQFAGGLRARFDHTLAAGGDYVMLVGLVEGKFGYVLKGGAASGPSTYTAEGRVKLYAKGRIQGRWLLEGALNVDSTQLQSWRDLFRGDPQRIFRNLDPDRFYTVYGDSSATTQPANSRARLFVRIQFDRSELYFGNLQTGLTGVEMGRYSRAVTGGRLSFVRAAADDPNGPPSTQLIVFGAWLQTMRAHDELRGTGGSLMYLSHRNVVEGSEQVRIEIRDRISDRPLANTAQRGTVDYEVDYLAGRVLLREPLSSVGPAPALVKSNPIDGDRAFLIVDYEYLVDGDVDDGTAGARVTQKIGPVRLGGTFVNEFRNGPNYTLLGGDVQIDLKKYGVILGEYAHSYGSLSSFARSDDGGLTFGDAQGPQQSQGQREGGAWKGEADLHFKGVHIRPYARGIDQGYTDTAHAQDAGFIQFGGEIEADVWKLHLRAHYDERRWKQLLWDAAGGRVVDAMNQQLAVDQTRRDAGGEVGMQFKRWGFRIGARTERVDDADPNRAGHRSAVAARVDVIVVPKLTLYAQGQYAVEKGGGLGLYGQDHSLGSLGAIADLPWQTKLRAEASYGVMGAGGLLSLRSEHGPGRVLYGTVTLSQDRDDRLSTTVAAGGRERWNDAAGNARAVLFAEDQFRDGPVVLGGRAHVLSTGIEIPLAKRFLFGATFERGTVAPSGTPFSASAQPLDRTAGTLSASYGGEKLRIQARAELRSDTMLLASGNIPELQWLASGMLTWRAHKDFTVRAKAFFSHSASSLAPGASDSTSLARSTEASLGFAWRPSFTDRFALLGRYTFLDEGVPAAQGANGPVDPVTGKALSIREQAHVVSLGGEGRLVWRFALGEKIAAKLRNEPSLGTSSWFVLWVNRLSLHVTRRIDAVVEYRLLTVPQATLQHGVSVEGNVILIGHLRFGAGWNFANFSDNELTLGRGSEHGFFVRAEGFY